MLLFTEKDHERVRNGEIVLTWRAWKSARVKAGRLYKTWFGGAIEVLDVREVTASEITQDEAKAGGHAEVPALLREIGRYGRIEVTPETSLYRVSFRYREEAPAPPAEKPREEVLKRLARMDGASQQGPWTAAVMQLIASNPGTASRFLAPEVGMEQMEFKTRVRRLKGLGLTVSLGTGYELSALGRSVLEELEGSGSSS